MLQPERNRIGPSSTSLGTTALALAIAFALAIAAIPPAQAQTFNVLHTFTGGQDGATPYAGVAIDRGGNLYGTVSVAPASSITTFDAPGAGTGPYLGTFAGSVNPSGVVTGIYTDSANVAHGFVRAVNGALTEFDVSGAGNQSTQGTFPISINSSGAIAGYYSDSNSLYHGFMRSANGAVTKFDVPGAGTFGHMGTAASGLNDSGVIVGIYRDPSLVHHGFVRAANGAITTFDVPGASNNTYEGTEPITINANGDITGLYLDDNNSAHGFLRAANGAITKFDVPGAGTGDQQGTVGIYINAAKTISGIWADANDVAHGFVRAADGTITTYDIPGSAGSGLLALLLKNSKAPPVLGTHGFVMDELGNIAGSYTDVNGAVHGFARTANGTIRTFDAPGAGGGALQGTVGFGINTAGEITGGYLDSGSVVHGFLLTPAISGYGGVYKLTPKGSSWTENVLYNFKGADGANPYARVVFAPNGTLFGTTLNGGANGVGTVVNLRPQLVVCKSVLCAWTESVSYSFLGGGDGAAPSYGDLVFDASGDIYGTTAAGGAKSVGTVYELKPSGNSYTESVLYTFQGGIDGAMPFSDLVLDGSGNLYGTTTKGGSAGGGTVFELTPSGQGWTEHILYNFQNGSDGSYPTTGLVMSGGSLYGSTANGGSGGGGTIFKLTPSGGGWTYSLLYSFTGAANCGPWGSLAPDGAGSLYGATLCEGANSLGNVFKIGIAAGAANTVSLHDFTGGSDGKLPYGGVLRDTAGNLYGTASAGGSAAYGVVWEITP